MSSVANKLRDFHSMMNGAMQAQVSSMVQEMREIREEMKEVRGMRGDISEMREEIRKIKAARASYPKVTAQRPPASERGYSPRADLWFFLRDHGEDMGKWDGKPTSVLAARVHQLREGNANRGSYTKEKVASTSHDQGAGHYRREDDLSDPLEGTSTMYVQERNNSQS